MTTTLRLAVPVAVLFGLACSLSPAMAEERDLSLHLHVEALDHPENNFVMFIDGTVAEDGIVTATVKFLGRDPWYGTTSGVLDSNGALTIGIPLDLVHKDGSPVLVLFAWSYFVLDPTGEALFFNGLDEIQPSLGRGHLIVHN